MKSAVLQGKTIKRVHQRWVDLRTTYSERVYCVEAIEFTDGTYLRFVVAESDHEHQVMPIYPARGPEDGG